MWYENSMNLESFKDYEDNKEIWKSVMYKFWDWKINNFLLNNGNTL